MTIYSIILHLLLLMGISSKVEAVEKSSVETIQELIIGPLHGKTLILYLDLTIRDSILENVLELLSIRGNNVIVTVDLASNSSLWCQQQTMEVLRGTANVHVVLFVTDHLSFFQWVTVDWKPRYLLLYSFIQDSEQIVFSDSFQRVERFAFMMPLLPTQNSGMVTMGIFTTFPFRISDPLSLLGVWNSRRTYTLENIFIDRFQSFEGYEFHLGTWFDDFPYLHQSKKAPEGVGDGVEVEMLDAIGQNLNYKYTLTTEPPDSKWGAFENGSWTGMLGMVHRKDKNFTVNYFVITGERLEAFDATVSYWMEGFGMSMLSPPPLPKWHGAHYPFMPNVWIAVVMTFAIIVLFMTAQDRLQPHPFLRTFGRTWPYLLRSVLNHSLPKLPEAQWQRIFVGIWLFYCFIITTAYTANLIAFLTIPVFPKRIQTVQELAESDYGISMYDYGEFVPGALKSSQDPFYRTLGERLELYPTYDGSVYPMLNGTHTYIESYSYNRILIFVDYEAKNSYMLQEQLYPGHLCWYFQKNTAWKYKFDHGIQSLVESGLIAHWLKVKNEDFLGQDFEHRQLLESRERKETSLTVEHLQGAFFILLMTWTLSLLVFVVEVVHGRCFSMES